MSEMERRHKNDAVDKIIGNMTPERQNVDGQYVGLGYSPNQNSGPPNWNSPQKNYLNQFQTQTNENHLNFSPLHAFNQHSFNFVQQQSMYPVNNFGHCNIGTYDMYSNLQNNYDPSYGLNANVPNCDQTLPQNSNDPLPQNSPRTQLIENLVGNWVMPNTSGTYSPFGNVIYPNSGINVYEPPSEKENVRSPGDPYVPEPHIDEKFQFSRDTRKPRMVAEVKPMRPTYSDVLTKAVPQTTPKTVKNGLKETKPKECKKKLKNEKQKPNSMLNRSNTTNELNVKEIQAEKVGPKTAEKQKSQKTIQLDRKWASMDNISEPFSQKSDKSKKKDAEESANKSFPKPNSKKTPKANGEVLEPEININYESAPVRNGLKRCSKFNNKNKNSDSFGANDRPPGKRNQRVKKKENHVMFGIFGQKLRQYLKGWWKFIVAFALWLFQLISDICSLSIHISHDMASMSWSWLQTNCILLKNTSASTFKKIRILTWIYEKCKRKKKDQEPIKFTRNGLNHNINMPMTGEDAMKRLLACKGKDPYSILGVTPTCTDDDIKRYYKRQAFLVHPDKNQQPGAEEAFKILVHAFDMIGVPERRAAYDRGVAESAQVEQAWSELTELLTQLQQKVEAAANTIRCSACGSRHKRVKIERPIFAARNCATCKIHHAAREGDIWAEARFFGFLWHYYACMDGGVYDITEWAGCQKDSLKHLKADVHQVQYRIALGKQNNQPKRHSTSPRSERPPDLENLLNTLYGQTDNPQSNRRKNRKGHK